MAVHAFEEKNIGAIGNLRDSMANPFGNGQIGGEEEDDPDRTRHSSRARLCPRMSGTGQDGGDDQRHPKAKGMRRASVAQAGRGAMEE
jgi:hypothetical protein